MNSKSKCNCHEEKEVCCKKEFKKEEEGTKVLLKCGNPGSVALPIIALGGLLPTAGIIVSTVTVNTEDFESPCIKFEFASNINTSVAGALTNLNFQIFRICKNQLVPIPVGPIFTYSRLASIVEANTFSFFVCDCSVCPDDCCTYTAVVTITTLGVGITTSINNATLSALVVENDHC